jgi:hypothetical protein
MGVLADAIAVFKDVMQKLTQIMTDLDRRLVRIETMVEIASKRNAPAKLPKN